MAEKEGSEAIVREIRRRTRKKYSSEEKIRIDLEECVALSRIIAASRRTAAILRAKSEKLNRIIHYRWIMDN